MYKLINRFDEEQNAILYSEKAECEMYYCFYNNKRDKETGLDIFIFVEDNDVIDKSIIIENKIAKLNKEYEYNLSELQNSLIIAQLNEDVELEYSIKLEFNNLKSLYAKELKEIEGANI